jgi:site-specific DNA-methyltransferase (adenine-specific)
MKRKRPCKKDDTLTKLIEEKVEEKVNELVNIRTMEPIEDNTTNEVIVAPTKCIPDMDKLINKIHLGECLELIRELPDNSIDSVITDPPYFLDGLCDKWNKTKIDKKGSSSMVGNLPKGMKFDRKQSIQFRKFYTALSKQIIRVLKPGGTFLSFSSPRLYHSMAIAIEDAGFEIRDMIGWVYTQSQAKAFTQKHIIQRDKKYTPREKEELIEKCGNRRTPQLKPAIEPICVAYKPTEGRIIDNIFKYDTGLIRVEDDTKTGDGIFPSNIVTTEKFNTELDRVFLIKKPTKKEKGDYNSHLSVKPVNLMGHLCRIFVPKDGIVLDPFMGSGTTALGCIEAGKKYIGFEINNEYIEICNRRIYEHTTLE